MKLNSRNKCKKNLRSPKAWTTVSLSQKTTSSRVQSSSSKAKPWLQSISEKKPLTRCFWPSTKKSKPKTSTNLFKPGLSSSKRKRKRPTRGSGTCRDSKSSLHACSTKKNWSKTSNCTRKTPWSSKKIRRDKYFKNVVRTLKTKSKDTKSLCFLITKIQELTSRSSKRKSSKLFSKTNWTS